MFMCKCVLLVCLEISINFCEHLQKICIATFVTFQKEIVEN